MAKVAARKEEKVYDADPHFFPVSQLLKITRELEEKTGPQLGLEPSASYPETANIGLRSARQIVPLLLDLVHVQSVVDVGCGSGAWLSVFKSMGAREVLGIDSTFPEESLLQIEREEFLHRDFSQPFCLDKKFDLAMALEVAEHLPRAAADNFVQLLCGLAPVVLFSAAIPHQGGFDHLNEQWPEYWEEKFRKQGYRVVDCLRKQIWRNEEVAYWYAQNLLIYVQESRLPEFVKLADQATLTNRECLSLVHPRMYLSNISAGVRFKYVFLKALWELIPMSLRIKIYRYGDKTMCHLVNSRY